MAAPRCAAGLAWVTWYDHHTLLVRLQLARGSRAGGRHALRASSSPASLARGTTSCRLHPSMSSSRARNCMTPAGRATGATSAALATPHPPSLIGRVVCTHAAWDVGVPTTLPVWPAGLQ